MTSRPPSPGGDLRLVVLMCLAEVLNMTGFACFAALLPTFATEWSLSHTEAGWISGIYFAGYTAAVPVLVSLTDRIDPRRVYLACSLLGGLAAGAFALLAQGFQSAMALRAAAGIGLAGTYMPGLKILSDRVAATTQSRAFACYTATFSIGSALSFLLSGELGERYGWPWAFGAAAAGSFLALALVAVVVPSMETARKSAPGYPDRAGGYEHLEARGGPEDHLRAGTAVHPLDFRPVLRNRAAMSYILGYAAHMWELFAQRSWIVAFLVYCQSLRPEARPFLSATVVAALVNLAGVPASILGNEMADRRGRSRMIRTIMLGSAIVACLVGFTAPLPYTAVAGICLIYGVLCFADSAALTVGAVTASDPRHRGATLAVHSCIGFTCSFLGPLVFGIVLDAVGNGTVAWGLAFASLGVAAAAGALLVTPPGARSSPRGE